MPNLTPTAELKDLLRKSGSLNTSVAFPAMQEIAQAVELPLRKGVLSGNVLGNIFEVIQLESNATSEFPLDFIAPGTEKEFVAYTIPNHGYIPQRNVEGDYVNVPTYSIGASIDYNIKYARDARWDIVGRAMDALNASFTKKMNDDGWQVILAAGVDRNILIFDSDAAAGQFTKRLVSLMKTVMRRNGGGNSTSLNRGKLTDLFVSPEAMEDIRNWNVDQVDEVTRREIFMADGDNALSRIFGVNLHDMDELGEGQEYQLFYSGDLAASMAASDVEIVVGLDLQRSTSFVMPVRETVQVFPDESLHRQRRAGYYAWAEMGFACLDNRNVLIGSL